MMWKSARLHGVLPALMLFLAGAAAAADATRVAGHIEAVSVAAREVQVKGVLYAMSSTVVVEWSNGTRIDLRDLTIGAQARMDVVTSASGVPLITRLVLLPD